MSADQSDDLNVRETARALGVHENTIRNWQRKGLIGAKILPSGVRRFSRQEVERMRREMWTQFAPATELPEPRRPLRKGVTLPPDGIERTVEIEEDC